MDQRPAPMVYIAGPYQRIDPVVNTRAALDAWQALACAGYTPVCPHMSLFAEFVYHHDIEFWYAYDLRLLERCDFLLRLPGDSPGADAEVDFAKSHGILVFEGAAEVILNEWGAF